MGHDKLRDDMAVTKLLSLLDITTICPVRDSRLVVEKYSHNLFFVPSGQSLLQIRIFIFAKTHALANSYQLLANSF